MADQSKFLQLVAGISTTIDLNGGTEILKVSSIKIGAADSEITDAIAQKLVKIGDTTDSASGADQVGATAVRTFTTVQSILEKLDTDLSTLESTVSGHLDGGANKHDATEVDYESASKTDIQAGSTTVEAALQDLDDLKISSTEKGANSGVATLDAGGKIPAAQLPNSVMEYLGTWAASTNTPSLSNGTGNAGDVYIASDAGTVDFGAGNITFAAGDWVVYSGAIWEKSINSNAVASVNSQTGAVVLDSDDISEGVTNLYFTNTRARTAAVVNSTAGTETDQAASVSAMKSYIASELANQDAADEITYSNATSGLTATDVQAAIDEVEGRLDTAESNITTNSSNISTNSTAITNLQGAVGANDEASINYSSNNYVTDGVDTVNSIGSLDTQVKTNADAIAALSAGVPAKVEVTLTNNTGAQIDAGDVVILSQTVAGEIVLADASAIATCEGVVGVASENIADTASGKVQIAGEVTVNQTATFDLGKRVYVSETAGEGTKTAPSTASSVVFMLGIASDTNKVILQLGLVAVN